MAVPPWSESLARMMFEQSPFSSVLYDSKGRLLAANAAFRALWGVDISSAPPDYSVLNDPELERLGVLHLVRRAFDEGEVVITPPVCYDISKLSATGEGAKRWTQGHFYPLLDPSGNVQLVILTHVDLTDRMEAEVRLRHVVSDLENLQALTSGLATAITIDEVARITLERARPAFGAGGGFVSIVDGEDFVIVKHAGFAAQNMAVWNRFPISTATSSRDAYISGEPIFMSTMDEIIARYPAVAGIMSSAGFRSMATLPLRAHGRILGMVLFHFELDTKLNDVQRETMLAFAGQCGLAMERAMLYESERKARGEAESANRTKSEFLARMSHELRTPLNAIDGYAELLEMQIRGPLNEAQMSDLARIRRSQKHLLALINDVLSFARIESGTIEFQMKELDVAAAVSSAAEVIAPLASAKRLELKHQSQDAPVRAYADEAKLHQILLNLLGNAVKFTESGAITVSVRSDGDVAFIDIADTGRGIPADRLTDIFEPFVQVESGPTRTTSGTGLGLAIARDLAHRMRGNVTACSTLGAGSTFTVTLPLAR